MDGLAAMITRSAFCQPPVMPSRRVKPLGTPVMPPSLPWMDSSRSMVRLTTWPMATAALRICASEIWKMSRSASSSSSKASEAGS